MPFAAMCLQCSADLLKERDVFSFEFQTERERRGDALALMTKFASLIQFGPNRSVRRLDEFASCKHKSGLHSVCIQSVYQKVLPKLFQRKMAPTISGGELFRE